MQFYLDSAIRKHESVVYSIDVVNYKPKSVQLHVFHQGNKLFFKSFSFIVIKDINKDIIGKRPRQFSVIDSRVKKENLKVTLPRVID